jgi:hypothetical protein
LSACVERERKAAAIVGCSLLEDQRRENSSQTFGTGFRVIQ